MRTRSERSVTGLSLVAFIASRHGDTDVWLEVDTGSSSALILDEPIAAMVGLATPVSDSGARIELRVDAIAVFIRQWLTANNRWGSPKAIAGESYGGQRVAALSRILAEQYASNLNWAVMLSPAFYLELSDPHYSLVAPMTLLPSQAAIAAHHGLSTIKNDPSAIKTVEDYAMTAYLAGLATQGRASPEEQATFYAKVGGLIGIEPALVANHRGRVSEVVFAANLLLVRQSE